MKDKILSWLNLALVADFFLVLLSFFWLVVAVAGHSAGVPLGLSLWYKLWQPVFTPAIGILMGGTIVSGLVSWLMKRSQQTL
jgi:hypothetical protein